MLLIVCATALWGMLGIFTMRLDEYGLNVYEISLIRSAICAAGIAAIMVLTERSAMRIRKEHLLFFISMGLAKTLCTYTMFAAQLEIPIALASVLQMTSPFTVMIFAWLMFGEKIRKTGVIAAIIALIGCVIVSDALSGPGFGLVGILLGLASAVFLSLNVVGTKRSTKIGYTGNTFILYSNLFSAVFAVFGVGFGGDFGNIARAMTDLPAVGDALMLSLGCTMLPLFLQAKALDRLDAGIVATVGMLEIVFAVLFGYMVGETLTVTNLIGILIIML